VEVGVNAAACRRCAGVSELLSFSLLVALSCLFLYFLSPRALFFLIDRKGNALAEKERGLGCVLNGCRCCCWRTRASPVQSGLLRPFQVRSVKFVWGVFLFGEMK